MTALATPEVVCVGYVVFGGRRPLGGPAYYLVQPGGDLFPSRETAKKRAAEIEETDDWWIEPLWERRVA